DGAGALAGVDARRGAGAQDMELVRAAASDDIQRGDPAAIPDGRRPRARRRVADGGARDVEVQAAGVARVVHRQMGRAGRAADADRPDDAGQRRAPGGLAADEDLVPGCLGERTGSTGHDVELARGRAYINVVAAVEGVKSRGDARSGGLEVE